MTSIMQRFLGGISCAALDVALGGITHGGAAAGVVYNIAGAPTNGTSGTLAGIAGPGRLMVDITNKVLYQNTNTLASPTWTALTTATGAGTYTGTFDGVIGGNTPAAASVTTLAASGLIKSSVAVVTAHAGGTKAAALALTAQFNRISVCATTADSVLLPAAAVGEFVIIDNGGAAAAQVFGAGTDTIDGVATATGVPLTNAKRAIFICYSAGAWISAQLGVSAA